MPPEVHCVQFHFDPDLAGKCGHGCFAVRPCHRNHGFGMCPEPKGRCLRKRAARIFCNDQCRVGCGEVLCGDVSTLRICQNGRSPHAQSILDKFAAMHCAAGKRKEQRAVFDIAAVNGKTTYLGFSA